MAPKLKGVGSFLKPITSNSQETFNFFRELFKLRDFKLKLASNEIERILKWRLLKCFLDLKKTERGPEILAKAKGCGDLLASAKV